MRGAAYLSDREFADRFFGRAADDPVVEQLRGAAREVAVATGPAALRAAAEKIAGAMQTVGLDRWQRFLSDAQDRARDPATVAAVETSRPPPSSDAVNSIPFGQIEAALGLGPAVMAGRGLVAALRALGGAIFRRGLEDEPSASPRIDETFTPTSEILAPDGEMVGTVHPGATEEVRTVSPSEFRTLEERLLQGASPTNQPGYPGIWYQRPDGSSFGIRNSSRNGRTIDVSDPKLPSGLKVHQP